MKGYASAAGKGRNSDALRAAGWGVLVNPADPREVPEGGELVVDSGAWDAFQKGAAWDEEAFERALDRFGHRARFVVLPDRVAGGLESLELSLRWLNRCRSICDLVLIAVQDGMEPADLAPYVGTNVGIFMGGSTEWKLARMRDWGEFCAQVDCVHPLSTPDKPLTGCWYHVARVNTDIRFRMAQTAGATSIDGSSGIKFGDTIPLIDAARRQPDLMDPRTMPSLPGWRPPPPRSPPRRGEKRPAPPPVAPPSLPCLPDPRQPA